MRLCNWPLHWPSPQLGNHAVELGSNVVVRELENGETEMRRFGAGAGHRITCTLLMLDDLQAEFEEWHRTALNGGVNWFEASWLVRHGYENHCARILGYVPRKGYGTMASYYELTILVVPEAQAWEDTEWRAVGRMGAALVDPLWEHVALCINARPSLVCPKGNTISVHGCCTHYNPALESIWFDGNTYLTVPSRPEFYAQNIWPRNIVTVECWVLFSSIPPMGWSNQIVGFSPDSVGGIPWGIALNNGYFAYKVNNSIQTFSSSYGKAKLGRWYHLCFEVRLLGDNPSALSSLTVNGEQYVDLWQGLYEPSPSNLLYLGRWGNSTGYGLRGAIRALRITSHVEERYAISFTPPDFGPFPEM